MVDNNTDLYNFCHEINTLHPNLHLTQKHFIEFKLSILDTKVKQLTNQLHTNVYRKPTKTSLKINTLKSI